MLAPLPAELADLLARLRAAGGGPLAIGAEEVEAWPARLADALLSQGAIERAAAATSIVCPGCEEACTMPVNVMRRGDAPAVAFVVCDKRSDMGRVSVSLQRLNCWHLTLGTLAGALAKSLDQSAATWLAPSWRLGWVEGASGRTAVLLQSDGGGQHLTVAGHRLELQGLLTWDGMRLGLDRRALMRHAEAPIGGVAAEGPQARAQRYRARKADLVQHGVRDFLQKIAAEEGISASRVKQIIGSVRLARKASPFDGLGGMRPTSSPRRRKG